MPSGGHCGATLLLPSHPYQVTATHLKMGTRRNLRVPDLQISFIVLSEILDTGILHYSDVIMSVMASQITGVSIVYSTLCPGTDKRKTSKLCVTGLCEENPPVTGELPTERASNAEKGFHLMTSSWVTVILTHNQGNIFHRASTCHMSRSWRRDIII